VPRRTPWSRVALARPGRRRWATRALMPDVEDECVPVDPALYGGDRTTVATQSD
jgi:hypothetical protein